jgi:hypothetical protein
MSYGFGGPVRPLPGQRGYNMRESDKLAEETREMQINLMKIQEQMKKVKSRGGDVDGSDGSSGGGGGGGGGRWRSARADRGGLRQYNNDIKKGKIPRGGGSGRSKQRSGPREMVRFSFFFFSFCFSISILSVFFSLFSTHAPLLTPVLASLLLLLLLLSSSSSSFALIV